jgi:hypothetical protein
MDTLVLQFSRWRSAERGFLKSAMGQVPPKWPGAASPGCGSASERSPQVVERPLRGPRADAIAVAK